MVSPMDWVLALNAFTELHDVDTMLPQGQDLPVVMDWLYQQCICSLIKAISFFAIILLQLFQGDILSHSNVTRLVLPQMSTADHF